MKKIFTIVLAVLIGLAFVTTTFAQDKAAAPAKADKPAVAAEKKDVDKDKAPAKKADKPKKEKKEKKEKKAEPKKDEAKKDEAKPAAPAPAPAKK